MKLRPVNLGLALMLGAALAAGPGLGITGEDKKTKQPGRFDKEFRPVLDALVKAMNTRDVKRIQVFYAEDVYARLLVFTPHIDDGATDRTKTAERLFADLKDFQVKLTEEPRLWKKDNRVFTLSPFIATAILPSGEKRVWKGRHSAIWEKRGDQKLKDAKAQPVASPEKEKDAPGQDNWIIVQERLIDSDTAANPFQLHIRGGAPAATPAPAANAPAGGK